MATQPLIYLISSFFSSIPKISKSEIFHFILFSLSLNESLVSFYSKLKNLDSDGGVEYWYKESINEIMGNMTE